MRDVGHEIGNGSEHVGTGTGQPKLIPAGPEGPGGWDCHTFPNGLTLPLICLADNCPDKDERSPDRFEGEVLHA